MQYSESACSVRTRYLLIGTLVLVYKIHSSTPQSTPPTPIVLITHLLTEAQWLIEGEDLLQVTSDISVGDSVFMIHLVMHVMIISPHLILSTAVQYCSVPYPEVGDATHH